MEIKPIKKVGTKNIIYLLFVIKSLIISVLQDVFCTVSYFFYFSRKF